MHLPVLPKTGLYWKVVPLILAALSLVLFFAAALVLSPWDRGWQPVLLLFLLSVETLFLPFLLLPLSLRLPTLLPWVDFAPGKEFSIDGPGRMAQRIILGMLIVLSGLPVLTAHDAVAPAWVPGFLAVPVILVLAARGTVIIFALLALALAIPDLGGKRDGAGPA